MDTNNTQPRPIRVMIVDDEPNLREAWESLVNSQPDMQVVESLEDANDLATVVDALKPDVVLLDLLMPGKDPLAAVREVTVSNPETRIIVYTNFSHPGLARRVFEVGASALTGKLEDPMSIIDLLRRTALEPVPLPREEITLGQAAPAN